MLASAVLEQSRALTSLVSHLQQGGDPLLGGQAQQQRDGTAGKASAAVSKQVRRFLSCCPAKCPSKSEACCEGPIDCGGGLDLRFQHDNLSGALRRLRCIQRTGLDPVV